MIEAPFDSIRATAQAARRRYARLALSCLLAGGIIVGCGVGGGNSPEAVVATKKLEAALLQYRQDNGLVAVTRPSEMRVFTKVYQRVKENYVRPVEMQVLLASATAGMKAAYPDPSIAKNAELIEAAIKSMLHDLDDYSVYMDVKAFRELQQDIRGTFGGLGIEIRKDPEGLRVISPIDGTPAKRAGIQPGDKLTHADGRPLASLTLQESVDLLRGAAGSTVMLRIAREERDPFDVPITRAVIKIVPVKARLEGDIGYLRVTAFTTHTGRTLRREMARLQREAGGNLQGYVLDVRRNPGGLLSEAVEVSSTFLKGGIVVSTRGRSESEVLAADKADPSRNLPIAVLIDRGSASASEIVAGAIKDRDRGIIVGEKSFGKGSVQSTYPVAGGGGLKLTTALYYTPGNNTVEGGITPDIESTDDPETDPDEALQEALKLVNDMAGGRSAHWNGKTAIR